jgi:hypothetical protein
MPRIKGIKGAISGCEEISTWVKDFLGTAQIYARGYFEDRWWLDIESERDAEERHIKNPLLQSFNAHTPTSSPLLGLEYADLKLGLFERSFHLHPR